MLKLLPGLINSPYAKQNAEGFQNQTQKNLKELNEAKNADLFGEGINGSQPLTSSPNINYDINSSIIKNNNSYIVLGRDAPSGPGTGKSKSGARCDSMDFVCGPLAAVSAAAKNSDIFVNSSFNADAARIYLSEFTDLDESVGLPPTSNMPFENRSAFAAIADNAAIKGRLGVKIATSPHGDYNSKGGRISSGSGIELIANSNETDLQPLVKGSNLEAALGSIYDRLNELTDAIMDISFENIKLMQALTAHTHVSPIGPVTPSLDLPITTIPSILIVANAGPINGLKTKLNILFDEIDYTFSLGSKYINSDFNRTN